MRSTVVKPNSVHVGEHCRLCSRVIKARQSIIIDTVAEIRFGTGAVRRWHTSCLRAVVEAAPDGVDELEETTERMMASGDAFV